MSNFQCDDSRVRVIISAGSDIGFALAKSWAKQGFKTAGTYRKAGDRLALRSIGVLPIHCELTSRWSVKKAARAISKVASDDGVSTLVFATGTMEPIGKFGSVPFESWAQSIGTNFLSQARLLRQFLGKLDEGAKVVFFAGGGTNNAPTNYSAYILSKIVLTKFCELLSKEYPDYAFVSVGPGWVNTKIHQQTIDAGSDAGDNFDKTISKIANSETMPMEIVIERLGQLLCLDNLVVSGRNFSLTNDPLDSPELIATLLQDEDMYKLRRKGNERFFSPG